MTRILARIRQWLWTRQHRRDNPDIYVALPTERQLREAEYWQELDRVSGVRTVDGCRAMGRRKVQAIVEWRKERL